MFIYLYVFLVVLFTILLLYFIYLFLQKINHYVILNANIPTTIDDSKQDFFEVFFSSN